MRMRGWALLLGATALAGPAKAETAAETAAAFGAREAVEQLSLSPDGSKIAFLAPGAGQGSTLYTVGTAEGEKPRPALSVSGAPDRLDRCNWVSEARLVCTVWGVVKTPDITLPVRYSRLFGVDAGGGNQKQLSVRQTNAIGAQTYGGSVIDWLPGEDNKILISQYYQKTYTHDTNRPSSKEGLAVDKIDTATLAKEQLEAPRVDAAEYITDGRGQVRIAGFYTRRGETQQFSEILDYRYRPKGQRKFEPLSDYNGITYDGFNPYAVDAEKNVAYGFDKQDGRLAVFSVALDGSGRRTLLASHPQVDVDELVRIGRNRRVVGATYATDIRRPIYFDPAIKALRESLARVLPSLPQIAIVDSSVDENRVLIHASADNDPGRYYLFDRAAKKLQILALDRPQLQGRTLATVRSITFPAKDGTPIPAYLTLPPGGSSKGLPAIVMPHGGPDARDEWGFDWLAQFYAARGYAVLQPNFRGSLGYGEKFRNENGFRNWRTAIGDIDDAGRWLVKEGIANPSKMVIVGWSYGGYAGLQSAVVDPGLYKAVVAIAPVSDLALWLEDRRHWSNYRILAKYLGSDLSSGSPAQNAAKVTVPVMLVHGTLDRNVAYRHSPLMAGKLKAAGLKVEFLSFDGLDHYLEDGKARAQMLEKSDAFIRAATGG